VLAVDLILGVGGDRQIGVADLVEAGGDIAPAHLHPHIGGTLQQVQLVVGELVDHALGVVSDRIETLGDLFVAFADLHGGDLLAHHFVEGAGLAQRPADQHHAGLVEFGDLAQQAGDRLFGLLLGPYAQVTDGVDRLVQVLQRFFRDDGNRTCLRLGCSGHVLGHF
jgi:hypothetical protein